MELASEEEGNCNNVTSGEFLKQKSQVEKCQSGSHVTTIIQDFTLVSLISSVTPHPAELPLGAAVPSLLCTHLLMHLSHYALVSLCTRLPMHSSPYTLVSLRTRLPTYSSPYTLVSLCTCLLTHSSPYALVLPLHPCTSRKNIPLRYLSEIAHLSRRHPQLS